jgi:hypothetical protein
MKTTKLVVTVPASVDAKLRKVARKMKKPKTRLAGELLAEALDIPHDSFLWKIRRHVGVVSGPGDLSTNKKYFEDYGR